MAIFSQKEEEQKNTVEEKAEKVKKTTKTEIKKETVKKSVVKKDKEKKDTEVEIKKVTKENSNAYRVLIKPIVTEKSANIAIDNKYVFAVNNDTNKIEVAKAVFDVYGVKPINVNILNLAGKKVTRGKYVGRRKDWKKAIVTLAKGKTIDLHKQV